MRVGITFFFRLFVFSVFFYVAFLTHSMVFAQTLTTIATTTLTISICGDLIINSGEQCDVPSDTGEYSTTIAGRQCSAGGKAEAR